MTRIAELAALGIALTVKGDMLHVKAVPGALTAELREQIKARKPELMAMLNDSGAALAPELEQLVLLVAKHYRVPPDEIEAMKDEAAKEPEAALMCFRDLADREGLLVIDSTDERKSEITKGKSTAQPAATCAWPK